MRRHNEVIEEQEVSDVGDGMGDGGCLDTSSDPPAADMDLQDRKSLFICFPGNGRPPSGGVPRIFVLKRGTLEADQVEQPPSNALCQ